MAFVRPGRSPTRATTGGGGSPASSAISLFHTDIDNGPNTGGENNNGAYVTLYGYGFGASQGTGTVTLGGGAVAAYKVWTNTKISVQLGSGAASGDFTVTNNEGQSVTGCLRRQFGRSTDFTVRSGSIIYVNTTGGGSGTFASPYSYNNAAVTGASGGTIVVFRSGTYSGSAGDGWGDANYNLGSGNSGTTTAWTTYIGYPGETVTISGHDQAFYLQDQPQTNPQYLTIANFTLSAGYNCVRGGHYPPSFSQGASNLRLVGNTFVRPGLNWNSLTGNVALGGDNLSIMSNEFSASGTVFFNQNHALYIQCHPTNVDICWNLFTDLLMGYTLTIHTDNDTSAWTNVNVMFNKQLNPNAEQVRGFNVGTVGSGSTGSFIGNVLASVTDIAALNIENGTWDVSNNSFYDIAATLYGAIAIGYTGGKTVTCKNNIISVRNSSTAYFATHDGASSSEASFDYNCFYNGSASYPTDTHKVTGNPLFTDAAGGDFTLQSGSPCRNAGTTAGVSYDTNGVPRPQGASYDMGAFEALA